ncbi:MAG: DUF5698 domain-containing protein [Spirochaetia bacterium]|nr:DUF5698 domain-containing protein [Spirochaetia bacterium]
MSIILMGILIFIARVIDVTLGTLRTLSIVSGRMIIAFLLGFVEISIWLFMISKVLADIYENPVLGIFYSLGFATGNAVGIMIEKKISFGHIVIRVIIPFAEKNIADKIREAGFAITTFDGDGLKGRVTELCVACQKDESRKILAIIKTQVPNPFYIAEQAVGISRIFRPSYLQTTGWRSVLKKK